ncbi:MAG: hypothetical protein Q4C54_10315 [Clostridia bacterium]|nr:hypothetical protein [Clostridia bacterium]
MKKCTALLLAVVYMLTLCVYALADSKYTEIKTELTREEVFGSPSYVDKDEITSFVLAFDYTDNTVLLLGFDEQDNCESLLWSGKEPAAMNQEMKRYCENFADYDSGDRDFTVAYKYHGDDSYTLIGSAEEATAAAMAIENGEQP